jgi:hypothetical protein
MLEIHVGPWLHYSGLFKTSCDMLGYTEKMNEETRKKNALKI